MKFAHRMLAVESGRAPSRNRCFPEHPPCSVALPTASQQAGFKLNTAVTKHHMCASLGHSHVMANMEVTYPKVYAKPRPLMRPPNPLSHCVETLHSGLGTRKAPTHSFIQQARKEALTQENKCPASGSIPVSSGGRHYVITRQTNM